MTQRSAIAAATFAAVVLAVGCAKDDASKQAYQDPFFPPRESVPSSKTMAQRQFAIAAAEDGMLFDVHFDGADLNSLGRQKLDAMISARPQAAMLRVYLNLPKPPTTRPSGATTTTATATPAAGTSDLTAARQASVEEALVAAGMSADQYALATGPNPGALRSAEAGVFALDLKRGTVGDATASGESTNLPVGIAK